MQLNLNLDKALQFVVALHDSRSLLMQAPHAPKSTCAFPDSAALTGVASSREKKPSTKTWAAIGFAAARLDRKLGCDILYMISFIPGTLTPVSSQVLRRMLFINLALMASNLLAWLDFVRVGF